MKTRVIQTRFWDDEKVAEFSQYAKYLYIYLLTCQYINVSGVFQLSSKKIQFETGLSDKQLEDAQNELTQSHKVLFCDGWVYVVNADKNNGYRKIPSNEKTYHQEWSRVPEHVKSYFNGTSRGLVSDPSGTSQGLNINNKSQIINNKLKIINNKSKITKEAEEIIAYVNELWGKNFKSSEEWRDNFEHWRQIYSMDEIKKAIKLWAEYGFLWKDKETGKNLDIKLPLLFRVKNNSGKCNYIEELLNRRVK